MKIFVVALIAGFLLCPCAMASEKPLIDKDQQKVEEQMKAEKKECSARVRGYGKIQCAEKIRQKYVQEGRLRGTNEYCENNYKQMGFEELEALLRKLKSQQDVARISPQAGERLPGELVYGDFMIEENWIKLRLGELQKSQRKEAEKQVFDKTQKP